VGYGVTDCRGSGCTVSLWSGGPQQVLSISTQQPTDEVHQARDY